MVDGVNYNHSQVREMNMSEGELWVRRVGRDSQNPPGIETPLGHTYSIILEEVARQGLDATPNPQEFLDQIKESLRNRFMSYEVDRVSLRTPSLDY